MRLPNRLQERPFKEWNALVKGIVDVWELAHKLGLAMPLEEHLTQDDSGHLAELLGRLGSSGMAVPAPDVLASQSGNQSLRTHLRSNGNPDVHRTPRSRATAALVSYFEALDRTGANPDDTAFEGGRMVRELILWLGRFGELHGLNPDGLSLLAREVLRIYTGEPAVPAATTCRGAINPGAGKTFASESCPQIASG